MRRRAFCALWLALGHTLACGGTRPNAEAPSETRGEAIDFAFGTLDGKVFTSEATRGRVTVLLFVTTFDLSSQVAARRVGEVIRRHVPKFNAAAIVLEAPENAVLVDVFRSSLKLVYPVGLADAVELQSSAAFSDVQQVPTLVVLDREGRLVRRHSGVFDARDLTAWLRAAEQ